MKGSKALTVSSTPCTWCKSSSPMLTAWLTRIWWEAPVRPLAVASIVHTSDTSSISAPAQIFGLNSISSPACKKQALSWRLILAAEQNSIF
jgi:hypothetical protein